MLVNLIILFCQCDTLVVVLSNVVLHITYTYFVSRIAIFCLQSGDEHGEHINIRFPPREVLI